MSGAKMASKYSGRCASCRDRFEAGTEIAYYSSQEVYHWDCRPSGFLVPKNTLELGQDGLIIVDTETGGLNADGCALVEVAAIAVSPNLVVQGFFQTYINPGRLTLTDKAVEIHGLSREFLADKPRESDALTEFSNFCAPYANHRFSGYNCKYDLGFLHAWYQRCNFTHRLYQLPPFDVWDLARETLGRTTANHKITTVADHFGLVTKGAHGALIDCFMTLQVLRCLSPVEISCEHLNLLAS